MLNDNLDMCPQCQKPCSQVSSLCSAPHAVSFTEYHLLLQEKRKGYAPSRRDFFAAAALTGYLAYPGNTDDRMDDIVKKAVHAADMTTAELDNQGKQDTMPTCASASPSAGCLPAALHPV